MAVHQYQARWLGVSQLPEDVFENVLYFDTTSIDTVEGTADGIVAAFDAWGRHSGINGAEVRAYDLEGGQPIFTKTYAYDHSTTAGAPPEVALCLSYATVDDPTLSTARRRGRIYLGPLRQTDVQDNRPQATLITDSLALGQALAQIGFASDTTWVMYSRTDQQTAKIESIWVDDAWDTQRRRGLAPTARTVQDVQ